MSSSTSFSTPKLFQNFLGNLHSRRLLLNTPLHKSPATTASAPVAAKDHETLAGESNFDANVVMIFSVLLCALICVVGLNSIIKCAVRYSRQTGTGNNNTSTRLANTGVKKKALKTFPTVTYTPGLKLPGLDTECVICLSEFSAGERVRILPKCNHGFHISCIDKWLTSHSSCPTCRHCLLETCHKIVGCSQAEQPLQLQGIILPLEPEGLVRSYRGDLP